MPLELSIWDWIQSRVAVSGNMKFDAGTMGGSSSLAAEFRDRYNISETTPLLIAASTHAPEESVILEALAKAKQSQTCGCCSHHVIRSASPRWLRF